MAKIAKKQAKPANPKAKPRTTEARLTKPRTTKARSAKAPKPAAKLLVLDGGGASKARHVMPSLGLATIERREGGEWVLRVGAGERIATLADNVEEAFAEECMRDQRTVLITDDQEATPAMIVGALQTTRTAARDAHDTLELTAERISLRASQEISLRAGQSLIRIDKHGVMRVRGQKMSMDVAAVVRIMSALVELP